MNLKSRAAWILFLLLALPVAAMANVEEDSEKPGRTPENSMVGKQAPAWQVDEWRNLQDGTELSVEDLKGKVVYLYCFQSWCPGCHKYGFPTLVKLIEHYKNDDKVAFAAVQTVFEGAKYNTPEAAWKTAEKFGLKTPVGHCKGAKGNRAELMKAYRTRGTPWTVIVGPDGVIRFSDFRITVDRATQLIDQLKPKAATVPQVEDDEPAGK